GREPEAGVSAPGLALESRQQSHKAVATALSGYRRHGHNEGDEPSFTQPVMYSKIKDRPTVTEVYTEQLILRGDLTAEETEAIDEAFQDKLVKAQHEVKSGPPV